MGNKVSQPKKPIQKPTDEIKADQPKNYNTDQNEKKKNILRLAKQHDIKQVKKQQQYQNTKESGKIQQQQKDALKQSKQKPNITEKQMLQFIRTYQLKNLTFFQIFELYKVYAMQPQFRNTLKSSLILLSFPALTNLYYLFRPNGLFVSIMPFAMPIICLSQYIYFINKDLENFCFNDRFEKDAKQLRNRYQILYLYTLDSQKLTNLIDDFRRFQNKKIQEKQEKKTQIVTEKNNKSDKVL